jgi:hypothetical protein
VNMYSTPSSLLAETHQESLFACGFGRWVEWPRLPINEPDDDADNYDADEEYQHREERCGVILDGCESCRGEDRFQCLPSHDDMC